MRKCFYVLSALFVVGLLCPDVVAQNTIISPAPDWLFEKPAPSNRTFCYHVESGFGKTETEARNNAYTYTFMVAARKLGVRLNFDEIREAVATETTIEPLSQRFGISLNVVCYRYIIRPKDIVCLILCQIPEEGYADNVQFDEFNDCDKQDRYNQIQKAVKAAPPYKDHIDIEENKSVTIIPHDGQVLILCGDKTFTITGQEVK